MSKPSVDLEKVLRFLKSYTTQPSGPEGRNPRNYRFDRIGTQNAFLVNNHGVAWIVAYNGGELTAEVVNSKYLPRNVPTTDRYGNLNEATVAYRLACVLAGEDMNFEERMSDEDQAILEEVEGK